MEDVRLGLRSQTVSTNQASCRIPSASHVATQQQQPAVAGRWCHPSSLGLGPSGHGRHTSCSGTSGLASHPSCAVLLSCCLPARVLGACSKSGKKATSCIFSADSQHVFFSDRFGDVLCATTLPAADAAADADASADAAAAAASAADGGPQVPAAVEASLLLGHLQSIVTSLACCSSAAGRALLVSTDKDGKVRASVLPANPVKVRRGALLLLCRRAVWRALTGPEAATAHG